MAQIITTDKLHSIFLSVTLFVIMPFVYSFGLSDIEQSPRFLLMGIIVGIAAIISAVLILKNNIKIRKDRFLFLTALFIVVNVFSFFKSTNFGDGLFELLKLLLILSLLPQFIIVFTADRKNIRTFLKTVTVAAIIFLAFGYSQLYFELLESATRNRSININYNILSTLGNKNFFAETLLLMLPICVLSIFNHQRLWRTLAIITSILIVVTMVVLQSMSTWVAMTFASLIILLLIFRFHKFIFNNKKAYKVFYLSISGAIAALFLSAFLFFQITGSKQLNTRLDTFKQLLAPSNLPTDTIAQNSSLERLLMWKHSISLIQDYPVTGAGLGNWKIFTPSYGMDPAAYMSTGAIRFVHPHNDYLYVASELGVVGIIIFLLMLGMLYIKCWRLIRNSETKNEFYFGMSLLLGLIVYSIISFFSMPLNRFYPLLLLMFFAALIISSQTKNNNTVSFIGKYSMLIVVMLSFIVGTAGTWIGNKRLQADFNLSSALLNEREGNYAAMRNYLAKIDRKYYPVDVTATPIAWYLGFAEFYLGNQQKAFDLFKEAEQANPNHLMVLNDLGTSYNLSGDPEKAKEYYNRALHIQPIFGHALINLSVVYFNANQPDSAYNTLIRHRGHFKREHIPVFSTILTTKAATFTKNESTLKSLDKWLQKQQTTEQLLMKIRTHKDGFSGVLREL